MLFLNARAFDQKEPRNSSQILHSPFKNFIILCHVMCAVGPIKAASTIFARYTCITPTCNCLENNETQFLRSDEII